VRKRPASTTIPMAASLRTVKTFCVVAPGRTPRQFTSVSRRMAAVATGLCSEDPKPSSAPR
jgi:hypothetical protein